MMKKLLSVLLILILLALPACAPAEAAAETVIYSRTWLNGAAYGYSETVVLLIATNDPAQKEKTQDDIAEGILFYPFDAAAGLYAGSGEPAGDRAEIKFLADSKRNYTVELKEPGKYDFSGTAYYLLDRQDPAQTALRRELDGAVVQCAKKTEKETAKSLHDWVCGRVSPVFPEEDAARLSAACADPMNALITGYACREAYAGLNRLLLSAAGIRCLTLSGTAGEEAADWTLCRPDETWCWTDTAMDDLNNKKSAKYLLKDDKAFAKDHTLCAEDQALLDVMIHGAMFDAMADGSFDIFSIPYAKGYVNYCYPIMDGPSWVVGDSATVTIHFLGNGTEEYRGKSPEDFVWEHISYRPWDAENHWYYDIYQTLSGELIGDPDNVLTANHLSIVEAAEDWSTFTVEIHDPGRYTFTDGYYPVNFYLISPDQTEPAAMAAEMEAAVEKAKKAPTEKETAKQLYQWIRSKAKYNYPTWNWTSNPEKSKATERDIQTSWDPIGGLIYGKLVCGGYSYTYDLLMHQAGLTDFSVNGMILPSYESHCWNVNRLDGEWTYTDVTWSRFCWTPEKMKKDHEALLDSTEDECFFGNAFDRLIRQAETAEKPLSILPLALKYLPRSVEDYGFPEKVPQFVEPAMTIEPKAVTVKVPQASRFNIIRLSSKSFKYAYIPDYTEEKGKKEITATILQPTAFRVQIWTDPKFPFIKKGTSQWLILDYDENGELFRAARRYIVADKTNYPGYNARYRFFEYDKDMNPVSAGWYMTFTGAKLDFRVYFDAEGKAERYSAEFFSYMDHIDTYWEGTRDQLLTRLKSKDVTDPDEEDAQYWEPVWFE